MENKKYVKIISMLLSVFAVVVLLAVPCSASEFQFTYNNSYMDDENRGENFVFGAVTWELTNYDNYYARGAFPLSFPTSQYIEASGDTALKGQNSTYVTQWGTQTNKTKQEIYEISEQGENPTATIIDSGLVKNGLTTTYFYIPDISYEFNIESPNPHNYGTLDYETVIRTEDYDEEFGFCSYIVRFDCTYIKGSKAYNVSDAAQFFSLRGDIGDVVSGSLLPSFTQFFNEYDGQYIDAVEYVSFENIIVQLDYANNVTHNSGDIRIIMKNGDNPMKRANMSELLVDRANGDYTTAYNNGYKNGYNRATSTFQGVLEREKERSYNEGYNVGYNAGAISGIESLDFMGFLQSVSNSIMGLHIAPAITIGGILAFVIGLALLLTLLKYFRG